MAAIKGRSVSPRGVRLYSVLGGMVENSFLMISPQPSSSFSSFERMRSLIGGHALELLARAEGRVLEIDGGRGPNHEWRSYEAVGRLIVRNCDLLIAIWDDEVPPKGLGGTRDTIRCSPLTTWMPPCPT